MSSSTEAQRSTENKEENAMTDIKKMTEKELTKRIIENRVILAHTKDINLKRKLVKENHQMMCEIDRRF